MTTKAYILMETTVGKTESVVKSLRRMPGVIAADAVTGPYDVIAIIQGSDANSVGKLVLNDIHGTDGVEKTMSCIAVGPSEG